MPWNQSVEYVISRWAGRVGTFDPSKCWNWTGGKDHSYGAFCLGGKNLRAHRASYVFFRGDIPPGIHVCHHCDNPICVNPAHLFLGTTKDNMADKVAKGRQPRGDDAPTRRFPGLLAGERCGTAKLTWLQVEQLREERKKGGATMAVLARRYNICPANVWRIVHNKLWNKYENVLR